MIDYPLTQTKLKLQAIISSPHDKIYVSHMKNIMEIAVDSRYKRQGIGTDLLTKIEWAKESGAQGVRLVLRAKKAHAICRSMVLTSNKSILKRCLMKLLKNNIQ